MRIVRYASGTYDETILKDSGPADHMEKDSSSCCTVYAGDYYIVFDDKDMKELVQTWKNPSYEEETERTMLRREQGDFSP